MKKGYRRYKAQPTANRCLMHGGVIFHRSIKHSIKHSIKTIFRLAGRQTSVAT